MKRLLIAIATAVAALAVAAPAMAATPTLFGGATQQNGTITLVSNLSDAATTNDFSGINFSDDIKFEDLKVLAAQFNVTDDGCGGGSPRFQLNVDGKNVFVYFGPTPNFTGCQLNTWLSTGNLIGSTDARFDLSQLGGPQAATYQQALQLLSGKTVTGVQLVVDSGWFFADKEQTVLVRNVVVNTTIAGSTLGGLNPAQACRAQLAMMGWPAFAALYGTETSNRRNAWGKCVSTMARAKSGGMLAATQATLRATATSCKSSGLRGRALGSCVARQSQSTLATVNAKATSKAKGKGKGKGK